jgi:hypothetical protein
MICSDGDRLAMHEPRDTRHWRDWRMLASRQHSAA